MFDSESFPFLAWRRQARAVPPAPTASFAGKVVLMTGASGAICSAAAKKLIDLGAERLILAVPDLPPTDHDSTNPRAEEGPASESASASTAAAGALAALLGADRVARSGAGTGTRLEVWPLDLLSFASVRALAALAEAELSRLDVALMGAAIITPTRRTSPADGWEATLQVNHLSCALLALLLLPLLRRSSMAAATAAADRGSTPAVLAAVSSMSVRMAPLAMPVPAEGETLLRAVDGVQGYSAMRQQYGISKLLFLYWLKELQCRMGTGVAAEEEEEEGSDAKGEQRAREVLVRACDFGVLAGNAGVASTTWEARVFGWFFGRPVDVCANVVVNMCVADGSGGGGGSGLLVDYDHVPYPKFMGSESGRKMQQTVWDETAAVLAEGCPEAGKVFKELDALSRS